MEYILNKQNSSIFIEQSILIKLECGNSYKKLYIPKLFLYDLDENYYKNMTNGLFNDEEYIITLDEQYELIDSFLQFFSDYLYFEFTKKKKVIENAVKDIKILNSMSRFNKDIYMIYKESRHGSSSTDLDFKKLKDIASDNTMYAIFKAITSNQDFSYVFLNEFPFEYLQNVKSINIYQYGSTAKTFEIRRLRKCEYIRVTYQYSREGTVTLIEFKILDDKLILKYYNKEYLENYSKNFECKHKFEKINNEFIIDIDNALFLCIKIDLSKTSVYFYK